MVNRIQEILKRYNLTAARFADQLDVPRSTISHILSERNKPSLEFIQKVLDNYPAISTNWLIKGEGTIFGKEADLFSELETKSEPVHKEETGRKIKEEDFPVEKPIEQGIPGEEDIHENLSKETIPSEEAGIIDNQVNIPQKNEVSDKRKIVRLIAFYEDNTFEEFLPAKNTH